MNCTGYDSYCGLFCGACEILNAETEEDKLRAIRIFKSGFPEWKAEVGDIQCDGCKGRKVFVNCSMCPIRACAINSNVGYCHECPDFPCRLHEELKRISELIPIVKHLGKNMENLQKIRQNGIEAWLNEQDERWRCPDCGVRFTWYAEKCGECGADLSRINASAS